MKWMKETGARLNAFWVLFFVVVVAKAILAWALDPCDDEAYYFYWSLHPQLSYFDHPPLTAWAMALSGSVFGNSVWTIRIWPLLAGVTFTLLGRRLATRMYGPATGDLAGILLLLVPAFAGNGLIMTPDTLFAAAWAAAVLFAWEALSADRRSWLWWALAGIAAGAGMLSKYNMVLFFAGLGFLWLTSPGRRGRLFAGGALCGMTALACFIPVIVWNARTDWLSFRFQLNHGFAARHVEMANNLGIYFGGILIAMTPVVGLLCFRSAGTRFFSSDYRRRFLAAFFWAVILFFGSSALRTSVEANWAILAFFTGLLLLAADWPELNVWTRRGASLFLGLPIVLAIAGLSYLALPDSVVLRIGNLPVEFARMEEFIGGQKFADEVAQKKQDLGADFVCLNRHQTFGKIAFFRPDLRGQLWLPEDGKRRFPWIDDRQWLGQNALIVTKSYGGARRLRPWFDIVEIAGSCSLTLKGVENKREVLFFLGEDYRPKHGK